ncbi:sugar 3,4-ketoisomerase [Vibrio hangzhouensis]|uniref:sugar 3,4-ketoisomerase n=1 Tax=Vibrio hangzhouensis TaxID=462991 RepID=UPI001C959C29|nr:FdtA/QdtA family cupin domain-containing protein [Vibrio hangzhouensis]MBY6198472.1 FdtA/QdtA family cupin domain-containing protein [Vibrio hangzhouensis]
MSLIKTIEFTELGDDRGTLIVAEQNKNIPFDIKRAYYLYGMQQDIPRGFHAHRKCQQVAVCLSGSCDMVMDDGKDKETFTMCSASQGLIIDVFQWHEMHNFSEDCILLVLASELYDEADYIRDYQTFLSEVAQ